MIQAVAVCRHRVSEVREVADGLCWLTLARDGLVFEPGDCVALYGPDGASRPYSIASGTNDDFLLFLIRPFAGGRVSSWLCARDPGDEIGVSEPFGWFRPGQTEKGERALFLATGTGIAPFLSYRNSCPDLPPYKVLYGTRSLRQAAGLDALDGWCDLGLALSREPEVGYHHGRIGDLLDDIEDTPDTHYYLCGQAGMIREVSEKLEARGVPMFRVHREVFFHEPEKAEPVLHLDREDWRLTPEGDPRGYIQPQTLRELWFHTGTNCNLRCPFCLEGSNPWNNRLQPMNLEDVQPFIHEALALGIEQFSFTGGEPFVMSAFDKILAYALEYRPCLVLTNATEPLMNRLGQVRALLSKPHAVRFRVSLDHPDPVRHDLFRGQGNFALSLKVMQQLHLMGFGISIARQQEADEDTAAVNAAYIPFFREAGLPEDTHIVVFPDLHEPGSNPAVPHITEKCMTTYKTENDRSHFMCNFSKMVVKQDGRMRVYACTLVDDDADYDLGGNLTEAMRIRVMLKHHRCYTCFAAGTSCSEMKC